MKQRILLGALATALLLAACADEDPGNEEAPEPEAGEEELDLDDLLGGDELPDPQDQVEDGEFRGEGIVLPVPDGFTLDPGAFMQGVVAAISEDGSHQLAGQALDAELAGEGEPLETFAADFVEVYGDPELDESVEVSGATEARQLRFDAIELQGPDQPELTLLLIVADDGGDELAIFNYLAPVDEYDHDEALGLLAGAGFDPDSSAPAPQAPPAPEPAPEP